MKNYLAIFLLILLFKNYAIGYDTYYIRQNPYRVYDSCGCCCPNCYMNKAPYNPYWVQKNITYTKAPSKKLRKTRRLQRKRMNQLSWIFGNNNGGSLTGYSVPINKDIYKQMGISPYNPKVKTRTNSPNCNQELFSMPSGDEIYYKNGKKYTDIKGISGRTGVNIIYD